MPKINKNSYFFLIENSSICGAPIKNLRNPFLGYAKKHWRNLFGLRNPF
jgi:hypothetical protein